MSQTPLYPNSAPFTPAKPITIDDLEHKVVKSTTIAWGTITGLPTLGILASLLSGLPLFAAVMAGCFLLATTLVCRKALVTFTVRTLQILVTARLVVVLVLGAILFCVTGSAWTGVVSAVLLWLAAGRLLDRRALDDLRKQAKGGK